MSVKSEELPQELDGHVGPPTVATSRWSGLLPANAYTIRAALFTCSGGTGAALKIYRQDRRILLAEHYRSGWSMMMATDGQKRDQIALRFERSSPDTRVKMNWLRAAIASAERRFSDAEAEVVFLDFIQKSAESAKIVRWVALDWR